MSSLAVCLDNDGNIAGRPPMVFRTAKRFWGSYSHRLVDLQISYICMSLPSPAAHHAQNKHGSDRVSLLRYRAISDGNPQLQRTTMFCSCPARRGARVRNVVQRIFRSVVSRDNGLQGQRNTLRIHSRSLRYDFIHACLWVSSVDFLIRE